MHKGDALNYIYYVVTGSMEILKGGMVVAILGNDTKKRFCLILNNLPLVAIRKAGLHFLFRRDSLSHEFQKGGLTQSRVELLHRD